jgi:hypothetical protein
VLGLGAVWKLNKDKVLGVNIMDIILTSGGVGQVVLSFVG